jgi:hypothetical protein
MALELPQEFNAVRKPSVWGTMVLTVIGERGNSAPRKTLRLALLL